MKANIPWRSHEDAAYSDGGAHDQELWVRESVSDANVRTFSFKIILLLNMRTYFFIKSIYVDYSFSAKNQKYISTS